jgi:glycosyltransferase involved in cell wall biosynthesis
MLVSVCMIVRNEELNLPRALESIPDSFEKVVVDTGSTDNTVNLAVKLGANVGSFQWINDFAAARNHAISLARGKYILILDADEALAPDTEEQVRQFIMQHPNKAAAASIENFIDNEIHVYRMVRFFPNDGSYRYQGAVHETLYKDGSLPDFEFSNITINHYGYDKELYQNGDKAERYLNLYKENLRKNPHDGYMYYQLGKLYFSMNRLQEALDAFERCLEIDEQDKLYYPVMLVMVGYVLKGMGQSRMAEELLAPFIDHYPAFPDLPFLLGLLAIDTGNVQNIEYYFLKALEIGETIKYSSVKGVGSFKAAYNLGLYYELTGDKNKASRYYGMSASLGYLPAQERLANL